MVTSLIAARVSPGRVGAVVARNVGALRSGPSYWLILVSGFFEPLLYLLSIGVGVGALVGDLPMPDGTRMPYAVFVAPAMLAVSAVSGAVAETTFNFFFKMKYQKTFEAVLATPVGPVEIALGELVWAVTRGAFYSGLFLVAMIALGLVSPAGALAAFPAAVLVGVAFGAAGMAVSTVMRGWQDFDLLNAGQFAMFLFSGTFSPVRDYPEGVRVLVECTPLYHSVELIRGLALGSVGPEVAGHVVYLLVMTAAGLWFAAVRLRRRLCS
jgi:ABC-type polysaccharide/polyol phosphate export systems, permease component